MENLLTNTLSLEEKIEEKNSRSKQDFILVNMHGNENSVWMNRIILGENLNVLTELTDDSSIAGKVSLIYIDPPFATNQAFRVGIDRTSTISFSDNDQTAYVDKLVGRDYLTFLKKRLILLREILAENGSIYLHIDYKVGHYVKILMDEVFGQKNFVSDITRIKCNPKNFNRKGYGNIKDMILFYAKSSNYIWNEARVKMSEEDIFRLFPKTDECGRKYTTVPLHAPGETKNGRTGQAWRELAPPKGRHWRVSPEELELLDEQGLIEWSSSGNPRRKIYADEKAIKGKKLQDVWTFKDPQYPSYPTEKNLSLLRLIIETSSDENDIVLDSFVGSGSTLVAAELCGRRWIGIDNSQIAVKIAEKRLTEMGIINPFTIMKLGESHE